MKKNQPKAKAPGVVTIEEAIEEPINLLTKASLKVYTKGGNDVYTFLKHARAYVRRMAGISGRSKKSAESLNQGFAAIMAD